MSPGAAEAAVLTLEQACRTYAARLVRMTDAQLAIEAARIEALPGVHFRHLVDEEQEIRHAVAHDLETAHAALLSEMAPTTKWGCTR